MVADVSRRSSASSASSSQKFQDAVENPDQHRFSAEEEKELVSQSTELKTEANDYFGHGDFSQAISTYDRAVSFCPNYLDYEMAVLRSNIAACHIKLEDWKSAVDSATQGLDALDRAEGKPAKDSKGKSDATETNKADAADATASDGEPDQIIELDDTEDLQSQLKKLQLSDERKDQIDKLRGKLLLRRAKGNQQQAGWANLAAAETDYRELIPSKHLLDRDRRFVQAQLSMLPGQINEAKEKEVGEMMGKLKDLGNSFLKPFGLSTNNFNMVKDENTGGYSMNFTNGSGK